MTGARSTSHCFGSFEWCAEQCWQSYQMHNIKTNKFTNPDFSLKPMCIPFSFPCLNVRTTFDYLIDLFGGVRCWFGKLHHKSHQSEYRKFSNKHSHKHALTQTQTHHTHTHSFCVHKCQVLGIFFYHILIF